MRYCRCSVAIAALVACAPAVPSSADDEPAPGVQAVLVMVEGDPVAPRITGLEEGKLTLAGQPPRSIALSDIEHVEIGRSIQSPVPGSDLLWIGQDNHDLVQVGGASGGNGIQDLHLHAMNLKPQGLKQVAVVCRFPSKLLRVWRLDTSKSPHWRLAIARSDLGAEAELYLEPAAEDSFEQKFDVTFTYNDGTTTVASVKAQTHSSDKLKVDSRAKTGQPAAKLPAAASSKTMVYLGADKADPWRLRGDVTEMNSESMTLRTEWNADLQIPLLRVGGVWFGKPHSRADFDKQLAAPPAEDVVFLLAPDQSAAQVAGSLQGLSPEKLTLRFEGADRSIKSDRVLGLVMAAHPKIPAETALFEVLLLASGDSIAGHLAGLNEKELEIETLWQSRLKVPTAVVSEIRFRNGRITYLPDLEPVAVEEVGYFGRVIHWQRDRGFDDAPAKVKGKHPSRSLAMHSRCVLTYALDAQYERFKATVGFDDSGGALGRVLCRVLVDGREAFAEKDLRADQEPRAVDVSIDGARQLALEVDYGETEDVGDRVIWAEPRLFRRTQP